MTESILLAMNGSESAREAARQAIDMASQRDATLHVVCVIDRRVQDEPGLSSAELVTIEAEDKAHECIADVLEMAGDVDVEIENEVRHGVPADHVLEYADDIDAAVIVIGEHGDHETHLGGVGREVARRSDREVIVAAAEA